MSTHNLSSDIDVDILRLLCLRQLRMPENIIIENEIITGVEFIPDLTPEELITFGIILAKSSCRADFRNVANWGTWTPTEAETYVNSNVLSGYTKQQAEDYINTTVTNIATAKTVMVQLAHAIIDLRTILGKVAYAVTLLRTIVVDIGREIING